MIGRPLRPDSHELLKVRSDPEGDGMWGAPRKGRQHRGIDIVVTPGEPVVAPVPGVIYRNGYCYDDSPRYRYVEIKTPHGLGVRLLYVMPMRETGDQVQPGDPVGVAQNISKRYSPAMIPHIHMEVELFRDGGVLLGKGHPPKDGLQIFVNPLMFELSWLNV